MRKFSFLAKKVNTPERSLKMLLMMFLFLFIGTASFAQRIMRNPEVSIGHLIKVVPSLRDLKIPPNYHPTITRIGDRVVGLNEDNEGDMRTLYSTKPKADPVVQLATTGGNSGSEKNINSNLSSPPPTPNTPSVITQNFDGMGYTNVAPADPTMCAGPNHIIQMINGSSGSYLKVWDRNGVQVVAQTYLDLLVAGAGFTGSGDPVALYDQFADRYMLTEFGHAGAGSGINTLIVVVSQSPDPAGGWYVYKFTDNSFFPDYPHWGIYPNAMFASTNDFNTAGTAYLGSSVYAMNKTKMIAGDLTAEVQRFRLSFNTAPVNISGSTPPAAGAPGMFMYYSDDDFTASTTDVDSLGILTFQPNFAVPANTILAYEPSMVTAPFKSGVCGGRNCVPSAAGNGYDALSDRIMNRAWYRKFATYESLVVSYTVDANAGIGAPKSGIRWYELRRTGGNWSIYQQSTYASCNTDWRWMPSININSKGQIALSYNLSSPTKYASIYFTGRNSTDPLNTMTTSEVLAKAGTQYGTFGNRWGDYNDISADVVNDSLFWTTAMYGNTAGAWATRITQFKIGDCDVLNYNIGLTQAQASVPEGQNIVYTNTVNNTGCAAIVNYLLTDTLPTNVTFVSATNGGTYNAGNRVVSWTVNLNSGLTATYQFTVSINAGAYFAPVTLLNEPVAGPGIPAGWAATTATGASNWVVSAAQSHSAPNSLFGVDNAAAITDFRISSTVPLALGAPTSKLTFWHNYNTESGWDGGVVEISTNGGGTWIDLGPQMTTNGYNNTVGGTNPITGRPAFSGNSGGWIQTTVSLLPYAGQNVLFRFRMTSDDNTAATGWYVDDINVSSVAQVNMRTTITGGATCGPIFKDTITMILPPAGCTGQTVTSNPSNVTTCAGTAASFSVTAAGTPPITYQWQESINGGGTWNNITNGGIYSNATTSTLNISAVNAGMNGYQYRAVVSGCTPSVNSTAATLTVVLLSVGGTVNPPATSICGTTNTGTLTLTGQSGAVVQWESATVLAGPYTAIPATAGLTSYTYNNLPVTTYFRVLVQAPGCASATSSVATVTIIPGGLPMTIVADPGTTVCAGDPTRLTVMEGGGTIPVTASATGGNTTVATGLGVSCGTAVTTSVNSYWRVYPLATYPAVTGNYTINSVRFGVEISTGGPQNVVVSLYDQTGAAFPGGTRTLIATQTVSVANLTNAIQTATFTTPPTVSNTQTIVVEVRTAGVVNTRYFPGATAAAETSPSYISAAACAINAPVTYASIGFPNTHLIEDLIGTVATPGTIVTGGTFLWSPAAGLSSTTTNPVAASPAITTTYTVSHNNGAGCIRTAQITITVNQRPVVTSQPSNVTLCSGTIATFTVGGTGAGLTYQWQESTNGGVTYNNLLNVAPYSNVTTPTLTISPVSVAMNGNRYRAVISGTCPPGLGNPNISNGAILTVNALPNVTVTPAGPVCGGIAGTNAVQLTASGANTYTWSPATGLYLNSNGTGAYIAGSNATTVYAAPTVNTTYTVSGTSTATGCVGTATVVVNYTPPAPTVFPGSATMCLGDVPVALTITSSLAPTTVTLTNSTPVAIPDNSATGVQSVINVAGVPVGAVISSMSVTLNMVHTYPADMIINLKAPNGQILSLYKHNTQTDNGAASIPTAGFFNAVVNNSSAVQFKAVPTPYQYGITAPTGPFAPDVLNGTVNPGYPAINDPAGFVSNAPNFPALYSTPNGAWTLAMADGGAGDVGTLNSWTLSFTYGTPSGGIWTPNGVGSGLYTDAAGSITYTGTVAQTVYARPVVSTTYSVTVSTGTCTSPARLVPVTVNNPVAISAQSGNQVICTNKTATFSVTVTGTSPGYQWQESTNGGVTWNNITNGGVYSGATTSTLTLTNPPVSMNGYLYRVVVGGTPPCGNVTSPSRLLTVNPLPTVVISASPYTALFPGLITTLTSTVSPNPAATYTWFRNGITVGGATTGTLSVDVDALGDYQLLVTDVNGCTNTSNKLTIRDSVTTNCFLYPNPSNGKFQVRYHSVPGNVLPRAVTVYDSKGSRVFTQNFTVTAPYARMDVDLRAFGKGVFWVEIGDLNGNRISVCRTIIQ